MALAYQRVLGEDKMVVLCNLDGKKQRVKIAEEWISYKILLENHLQKAFQNACSFRGRALEDKMYIMEPYEFMVLGT